jgi:hypothetical protein
VAHSGFAFGIVRKPGEPKPSCIGLVLRGAAQGKVWELVGRILDAGKGPGNKTQVVNKPGGRTVIIEGGPPSQGFAWWKEGNDLVLSLVSPEGPDILIETLDGMRPDATDHPIRAALARAEGGFTPLGLAFFEMAALPALPPQAAALGFDKITRLDYRWGFQDDRHAGGRSCPARRYPRAIRPADVRPARAAPLATGPRRLYRLLDRPGRVL